MSDDRMTNPDYVWNKLDYKNDALIEASAGTGKTYALESIVLKLVQEKGYDATSILLVTFTEKAAGELKDRIRNALEAAGSLPGNFDEMTICTIHAFCSRILSEYAFESGVPMKCEIGNSGPLVHKAVRDVLLAETFSDEYHDKLYDVLKGADIKSVSELVAEVQKIVENTNCEKICAAMESAIASKKSKKGSKHDRQKELFLGLVKPARRRFEELKKQAALLTFDDIVVRAAQVVTNEPSDDKAKAVKTRFLNSIREQYRVALVDEFQDTDARQWDIFRTLFSCKNNKVEGKELKPGFLIVVGDPKQAIYSFRGADVDVYCAARNQLSNQTRTLSETFRSKKTLVDAFNVFFRNAPVVESSAEGGANGDGEKSGSNWFKDGAAGAGIGYDDVLYPRNGNKKFDGLRPADGEDAAVLLLESMPSKIMPSSSRQGIRFGNKAACLPEFMEHAAREMVYLKNLNPAYRTVDRDGRENDHRFSYSDMCVLVETGTDAAVVRRVLAKYGIPYGQYKQRCLYKSREAEGVLALLDYLARPDVSGNRTALLLSSIFAVHPSELSSRSRATEGAFDKFAEELRKLADDKDWNRVFERVMSDPCTALVHPTSDICAFNRTRSAVRQIFDDLLVKAGGTAERAFELAAILREWRKIDSSAGEDGSLYKKESEADRVQIITMHASKGLQYPVVFLAYGFSNQIKKETAKEDKPAALEERRRLLYVALTRAEYRLYLPWSKRAWEWKVECGKTPKDAKDKVVKDAAGDPVKDKSTICCSGIGSTGSVLLVGADSDKTNGFLGRAIQVYFKGKEKSAFAPDRSLPVKCVAPAQDGNAGDVSLPDQPSAELHVPGLRSRRVQWDSFSSIPQGGEISARDNQRSAVGEGGSHEPPEPHSTAVKAKTALPRNNVSGNVFHEIMETLCKNDPAEDGVDFTTACDDEMKIPDSRLMVLIRRIMAKNHLANREVNGATTEETLLRMVRNVLLTPVKIGDTEIVLKDVKRKDRLAEVEFVMAERKMLSGVGDGCEDAMNGKIDLIVRVDDKVFIMDWKTNSLPDYEQSVNDAMNDAGYHLQYKIYSLAVSEWIASLGLVLGGVAYLFVRGGETGERSGVFARTFDPETFAEFKKEISEMGYFVGRRGNR